MFSPSFPSKAKAIEALGGSDNDSHQLFAFDVGEKSGPKNWIIATLMTVFKIIFKCFPELKTGGRNILYECIELRQPVAFPIDLDLSTSLTGLQPDDNCDAHLLKVIDCIGRGFKKLFSLDIQISNWIITKSPYSFEKGKHSFHFTLTGFFFKDIDDARVFVKEIDAGNLGIDLAIYKIGCLRLMGCTKKFQQRPLLPYELRDSEGNRSLLPYDFDSPFSYFRATTVLYNYGYIPVIIPEEILARHPKIPQKIRPSSPITDIGGQALPHVTTHPATVFRVPFVLVRQVVMALSSDRADACLDWCNTIWAIFTVSCTNAYVEDGRMLAHEFSRRSLKYDEAAVDKLWSKAHLYGWNWPSIRGWLWEDNRTLWKSLRCDREFKKYMFQDMSPMYREQYMPHVDKFKDVITEIIEYNAPVVPPFEIDSKRCLIEHAAMGTSKTQRYVELILSGKYDSVLLLVNRQTLTRAAIQRLNFAIRQHMIGAFDPSQMFVDYRRPDEVRDPFEPIPPDSDDDDNSPVAAEPPVFLSDSDEEMDESVGVEVANEEVVESVGVEVADNEGEGKDEDEDKSFYPPSLMTAPRLIIQMESCHKIAGRKFDLVIADECESDIYQLSSPTMTRLKDSSFSFFQILKDAGKLLLLDAFPSDRPFLLLRHLEFPHGTSICYRHNSWLPSGRKAIEIEASTSSSKKKLMFDAIKYKLNIGKRVAVFTSSRACGLQLVRRVTEHFANTKKVSFYDGFTDGKLKDRHFDDVDKWWKDADLLIYTPVLLAGVSFNIKNHFHCLFVWAYSQSSHVRDMIQAAGRIRHFEIETMFYALDFQNAHSKRSLPLTFEAVKANIDARGNLIKRYNEELYQDMPVTHVDPVGELIGDLASCPDMDSPEYTQEHQNKILETMRKVHYALKMESAPAWLLDIHVRNKWEDYLTHNPKSFQTVFEDFLKLAGWERDGTLTRDDVINWENSMRAETGRRRKPVSHLPAPDVSRKYADILSIGTARYKECEQRRARGTSSLLENLQMEKYWFDRCIVKNHRSEEAKEAKELVFNEMMHDRRKKQMMINLFCEVNHTEDELSERYLEDNPFPETTSPLPTILKLLKELCFEIGLRSTYDFETTFTSTMLGQKLTTLQPIAKNLIDIMQLPVSTAKEPKKAISGNIRKIFFEFSGGELSSSRKVLRIDGGQFDKVYTYQIKEILFTRNVLKIVSPAENA